MALGVASSGACLPTLADAAAHACANAYPVATTGVDSGGAVIQGLTVCSGTTGATLNLLRYKNSGNPASQPVTYAGPACDLDSYLDGRPWALSITDAGLLGTAILAVWATAWGWKALARVLRQDGASTEES